MTRIAALVVAVGLIVGALIIRNQRDEEERRGPYRLTCATEVAGPCRTLDATKVSVTIEPAGATADRLVALVPDADPGFDGWLHAGRWSEMVSEARSAAGREAVLGASGVLGRTHVSVAVWRDRGAALRGKCGATLGWKCLGDAARTTWKANGGRAEWGLVKLALADPVAESAGLVALAAATAGFAGRTAFVPADLAQDDAYQGWLSGLAEAVQRPSPDLTTVLTSGPSVADVYVGLDTEIRSVLETAARRGDVEVVNLAPVLDVQAVLATRARDARRTPDQVGAAVQAAGWVSELRGAEPVPPAVVLAGLRTLWQEANR